MSEAGSAFERPIRIEYRPSPRVVTVLAIMHLGALAAVAISGMPGWAKFCAAALIAAALFRLARQWLREFQDPVPPTLLLNGRDEWRLLRRRGSERLTAGTDSLSLPGLTILHLRDEAGSNRFFILAPDNAPADILRRLRVRLRFPVARAD